MAETNVLPAIHRAGTGKGAARAARRAGLIPGVVYGGGEAPQPVNVRQNILQKAVKRGRFLSSLIDLEFEGGEKVRVIPRDVQRDIVRDLPTHVDFLRLSNTSRINLFIPVEFVNHAESPGIKRGGVLNVVRHEVELRVRAGDIPEKLVCDLTGRAVGESIHISAIDLPKGAALVISDRDFTVATIAAPSGLSAATDEDEESTDGGEPAEA